MKTWLITLSAIAGLTWVASVLSGNDYGAITSANPRPAQIDARDGDRQDRTPVTRGREMMGGMMSMMGRMMNGGKTDGSMMDSCPMMNRDRPNNQWRSAPPAH